jgi:WD40 repeat protein
METPPHITVWDLADESRVGTIAADASIGLDVAPDGRWLATIDGSNALSLWRADGTGSPVEVQSVDVTAVRFSPDGTLLATGNEDGTVRVYDAVTHERLFTLDAHGFWVFGVDFSGDGRWLTSHSAGRPALGSGSVKVWALDVDDLVAIAQQRLTRTLTDEECRTYLRTESCADV